MDSVQVKYNGRYFFLHIERNDTKFGDSGIYAFLGALVGPNMVAEPALARALDRAFWCRRVYALPSEVSVFVRYINDKAKNPEKGLVGKQGAVTLVLPYPKPSTVEEHILMESTGVLPSGWTDSLGRIPPGLDLVRWGGEVTRDPTQGKRKNLTPDERVAFRARLYGEGQARSRIPLPLEGAKVGRKAHRSCSWSWENALHIAHEHYQIELAYREEKRASLEELVGTVSPYMTFPEYLRHYADQLEKGPKRQWGRRRLGRVAFQAAGGK